MQRNKVKLKQEGVVRCKHKCIWFRYKCISCCSWKCFQIVHMVRHFLGSYYTKTSQNPLKKQQLALQNSLTNTQMFWERCDQLSVLSSFTSFHLYWGGETRVQGLDAALHVSLSGPWDLRSRSHSHIHIPHQSCSETTCWFHLAGTCPSSVIIPFGGAEPAQEAVDVAEAKWSH